MDSNPIESLRMSESRVSLFKLDILVQVIVSKSQFIGISFQVLNEYLSAKISNELKYITILSFHISK